MARAEKLTSNRDFARVYRRGTGSNGRWVSMRVFRRRGRYAAGPARIGFAVNHTMKNAVERNRMKRMLREAFRLADVTLAPGMDVVVSGRWKKESEPELEALITELRSLVAKAGIESTESLTSTPSSKPSGSGGL